MTAVQHDLGVLSFLAACRALGMTDKLATGTLWRVVAKEGHIIDMNSYYQNLQLSTSWAMDAFDFMHGIVDVFKKLIFIKTKSIIVC